MGFISVIKSLFSSSPSTEFSATNTLQTKTLLDLQTKLAAFEKQREVFLQKYKAGSTTVLASKASSDRPKMVAYWFNQYYKEIVVPYISILREINNLVTTLSTNHFNKDSTYENNIVLVLSRMGNFTKTGSDLKSIRSAIVAKTEAEIRRTIAAKEKIMTLPLEKADILIKQETTEIQRKVSHYYIYINKLIELRLAQRAAA